MLVVSISARILHTHLQDSLILYVIKTAGRVVIVLFVQGMSIACSTPEALKWDPEWAGTHEISGRAMKSVHTAGSEFNVKRYGLSYLCCIHGPPPRIHVMHHLHLTCE